MPINSLLCLLQNLASPFISNLFVRFTSSKTFPGLFNGESCLGFLSSFHRYCEYHSLEAPQTFSILLVSFLSENVLSEAPPGKLPEDKDCINVLFYFYRTREYAVCITDIPKY